MKYIIISPETGEHVASISKDALQLASVLTNEHLFDMLKDNADQRLIDHVKHLNAELSAAVSGVTRSEINNVSLQQLDAGQIAAEPEKISRLEIVPNDTFEPNERVTVCKFDLGLILKAIGNYYTYLHRRAEKSADADGARYFTSRMDVLREYGLIFKQYYRLM